MPSVSNDSYVYEYVLNKFNLYKDDIISFKCDFKSQ